MVFGIVSVMKIDMIAEKFAAPWMVAELVMHQRLRKRHDQVGSGGSHEK